MTTNPPQPRLTREQLEDEIEMLNQRYGSVGLSYDNQERLRLALEALALKAELEESERQLQGWIDKGIALMDERDVIKAANHALWKLSYEYQHGIEKLEAERDALVKENKRLQEALDAKSVD